MGNTTKKTKKNTLKQQIYTSVLTDIIHSQYLPDHILTEKGLMEDFGVSRAPVREALIELCNEGVLESIPCYGYRIKTLSDKDIKAIQKFRIILETGFMSRFWDMITPEDLADFASLQNSDEEKDAFTHWNRNSEFHIRLMQCYHNPYAVKQLQNALTIQTRAFAQIRWERWHKQMFTDLADMHNEILTAIQNDNMPLACKLLEADIRTI